MRGSSLKALFRFRSRPRALRTWSQDPIYISPLTPYPCVDMRPLLATATSTCLLQASRGRSNVLSKDRSKGLELRLNMLPMSDFERWQSTIASTAHHLASQSLRSHIVSCTHSCREHTVPGGQDIKNHATDRPSLTTAGDSQIHLRKSMRLRQRTLTTMSTELLKSASKLSAALCTLLSILCILLKCGRRGSLGPDWRWLLICIVMWLGVSTTTVCSRRHDLRLTM
jgi:hypothetical protein